MANVAVLHPWAKMIGSAGAPGGVEGTMTERSGAAKAGHYLFVECGCGHREMLLLHEHPRLCRDTTIVDQDALARLRCSACGGRGVPDMVTLGWAAGGGASRGAW